jgi:hypothetical protein
MMPRFLQAELSKQTGRLQDTLRDFCRRRVDAAERRWSERYDRWREAERLYRAFRVEDADDQQRARTPVSQGVTKIVVPYGYATIQSILAFFMSVFTQRKPVIPVEGVGPSDVRAAYLMEMLLDRQWNRMEPSGTLILYQWLLDALRYGVGIIKNTWAVREWPELTRVVQPILGPDGRAIGYDDAMEMRPVVAYEGNEAMNVSPFDFLPDPHVPLGDFQKGEFVAHHLRVSWTKLRQRQAEGLYAGIEHIPRDTGGGRWTSMFGAGVVGTAAESDLARIVEMSPTDDVTTDDYGEPYVHLHELWAYIDPERYGLDGGTPPSLQAEGSVLGGATTADTPRYATGTPELWVFTLANGRRVIRAEPANLPGHRFPFEAVEINYDVHAPANFGMIETTRGLQYILSWLFNARWLAVQKTLNNETIYDPSMVEELDVLDADVGRLIRLKESAWGSGKLTEAMMHLDVQDVTQGHLNDARVVMELMEQVTAANRLIMGLANTGRRAATEVQGQMNLASGRMKMMIELVSHQGMQPWAGQMAKNTQAFAGELGVRLKPPYDRLLGMPFVQVVPGMLAGEFSFPFTEAGMPTDRLYEANVWKELLMMGMQAGGAQLLAQSGAPLGQMFLAIWGRFLHAMGIKDLQTFGVSLPHVALAADEQVDEMMRQGVVAPLGGGTPPGAGFGSPTGQAGDGFALPPTASAPGAGPNVNGSPVGGAT